jgi:hypothetical protein
MKMTKKLSNEERQRRLNEVSPSMKKHIATEVLVDILQQAEEAMAAEPK